MEPLPPVCVAVKTMLVPVQTVAGLFGVTSTVMEHPPPVVTAVTGEVATPHAPEVNDTA